MLFVWLAIVTFQVTLCSSKFYGSLVPGPGPCLPGQPCGSDQLGYGPSGPCLPGQPCGPRQPYYPTKLKSRRPALSAKFKKNKPADPCISAFVCTFVEKVQKCPELAELFGFFDGTSSEEFCYGKYPEILDALTEIGAPNPEFASQQAVEAIVDSFDILSCDIVTQVYANSIAKYLYTQGCLTPQNAVQKATQYANIMEEAAKCNDSQYTALKEGFVNFLDSLGLFTADKALLISLQYANEWKMQAKPKYG